MNTRRLQVYERMIEEFATRHILVLGDIILDRYIVGSVSRISPEAPVPVVEVSQRTYAPGGAANVAMNLSALGANVWLLGVVGDDEEGAQLRSTFHNNGIDTSGIVIDEHRPTTSKTRIIAHNQQVVRVDREVRDPIGTEVLQDLAPRILNLMPEMDAVIISDYAKGVNVPELLREVIHQARDYGRPVVVDPKGYDYHKYADATLVVPNRSEAAQFANQDARDSQVLSLAARNLLDTLGCQAVVITKGEEGMSLYERNGKVSHIPALAREVYDVTGAGDTVISVLALGMTCDMQLLDCVYLANSAAGLVVGKLGAATVSPQELQTALSDQKAPPV